MLRYTRWLIPIFCAAVFLPLGASGQTFEAQQRQAEQERYRQERREADAHQAQLEQMRQIERTSNRDQRRLDEQRVAQESAQQQYAVQQMQQESTARQQTQVEARPQAERQTADQPVSPVVAAPADPGSPVTGASWSYSNIRTRDKLGLAALGILLVALAFPAGIIPYRLRHR